MSEENKAVELKDDDLDKVVGGAGQSIYVETCDNWNKNDVQADFTSKQEDENLNINKNLQTLNEEFEKKAKVVDLTHF